MQFVVFSSVCAALVAVLLGCTNSTENSEIGELAYSKFKHQSYVMEYKGTPVGTHVTSGTVNEQNQLEYIQEFTLTSMQSTLFTAKQTLRFSPLAPSLLDQASFEKFSSASSDAYDTFQFVRSELGLEVRGPEKSSKNLSHDYALEDFLGIENWLLDEEIAPGDQLLLVAIRLEQHDLLEDMWIVKQVTPSSVLIRSSQGIESEYDISHAIPQLKISKHPSGLTLRHVESSSQVATSTVSKLSRQPTSVPVIGSLPRPMDLALLELSVKFRQGEPGPWSSLLTPSGTLLIDRTKPNESHRVTRRFDDNLTSNGIESKEIQDLAESITDGISNEDEKLSALIEFAHNYVQYGKSDAPQSVASTLNSKTGDCSDIADLLNALAIASGFESRTVYGLAYDKATKSFGIHAWNQVRLHDNRLRSVDPTWNQSHADATHIEFPDAYAHEVLGSLVHMELSVLRYEHFDSHI